MDRLPRELNERIVECIVWTPDEEEKSDEIWCEGPLRLRLPWKHPLRHLHRAQRWNDDKHDEIPSAAKSVLALGRTNKAFQAVCSRFAQEVLSVEHLDWPSPSLNIKGTASHLVKSMDLSMLDRGAENMGDSIPALLSLVRSCPSLVSLELSEGCFQWLPDILDALPRPELLRELDIDQSWASPSSAVVDRSLRAISRVRDVEVLYVYRSAEEEGDGAPWLFSFLQAFPNLLYLLLDGVFQPEGQLVAVSLPCGITRLHIADCEANTDTAWRLIEGCCKTLDFLELDEMDMEWATGSPSPVHFLALRLARISPPEGDINPLSTIVPRHWRLPAIRHLEGSSLRLSGAEEIREFRQAVEASADTLDYLEIDGIWYLDEEDGEEQRGELDDWVEKLFGMLREKGVDTKFDLDCLGF